MTNESKNEADKLTTNESSREITANELHQVVGGMGPVFLYPRATSAPSVSEIVITKLVD